MLDRLSRSRLARAFLEGVNAAAVALIAVVLVRLASAAFTAPLSIVLGLGAAVAILYVRVNASLVVGGSWAGSPIGRLAELTRP